MSFDEIKRIPTGEGRPDIIIGRREDEVELKLPVYLEGYAFVRFRGNINDLDEIIETRCSGYPRKLESGEAEVIEPY